MAIIESIPFLVIFLVLLGYSIGFFGVVHSGILQSIAARNYTFETFRHRSNLVYFRDNRFNMPIETIRYQLRGHRFHAIVSDESTNADGFYATERKIALGIPSKETPGRRDLNMILPENQRYQGRGVNPVWIKITYGICINPQCGD